MRNFERWILRRVTANGTGLLCRGAAPHPNQWNSTSLVRRLKAPHRR